MINIERILCPASLAPDEALRWAVSIAQAYQAKLLLCQYKASQPLLALPSHSQELVHDGQQAEGQGYQAAKGQASHEIQDTKLLMNSFTRYLNGTHLSHLHWELVKESRGDVGEEIVRVAFERRVDLIVMSSRRTPVAALLGSTAEHVSRTAPCPVLVTSAQTTSVIDNLNSVFRQALIAHDFSSSSELALSYALSIAQKYRADLHLLHVLPQPHQDAPEIAWGQAGIESAYQRAVRRLRDSVPNEVYGVCKVMLAVRWGKPYREVLAYVREQDIDLACMGALGRDFGLAGLFGSNVDRVMRQAPCPVLVARPLKRASPAFQDLGPETIRFRKNMSLFR